MSKIIIIFAKETNKTNINGHSNFESSGTV